MSGPTSSRRNLRQKLKKRYATAREDAQLAGIIPTTPEGALRPEQVDPRLQGCQQLPGIVKQALRDDWSVPDVAKPAIVGALLTPFFVQDLVLDKDGNQVLVSPDRGMLMQLAKVLKLLDQTQYERDHPKEAGMAKGGGNQVVGVSVLDRAEQYEQELRRRFGLEASSSLQGDGAGEQMAAAPANAEAVGVPRAC